MKHPDIFPERKGYSSCDTYIEFLSQNLGASREEIVEVTRRSGISARRIAEYLVRKFEPLNENEHTGL